MPPTASTTRRIVRSPAREVCSLLPHEPGVYRFRDERDRVMYVGRASDLRSRTRSYWGDLHGRRHLRRMVGQIARVEALVCQSVHEAAWLERNNCATVRGSRFRVLQAGRRLAQGCDDAFCIA